MEFFERKEYAQIDALAQQLRSQRVRFRGGARQLNVVYDAIHFPGAMTATDADWQAPTTKLQNWIAADPALPTPRIALAQVYPDSDWKARGNGLAKNGDRARLGALRSKGAERAHNA